MIHAKAISNAGLLTADQIRATLEKGLAGRFNGQKVLALIPDHTRSLPLPKLFRLVVEILTNARQLDFLVALGTHPAISEVDLNQLIGINQTERSNVFAHVGLLNHAWDDPAMLTSLGVMEDDEIHEIAASSWHPWLPSKVNIHLNRLALEYDHILIIVPTFPHEVVGFSGGAKYLIPGISGAELISAGHWLGTLATVVGTIGVMEKPVRSMINAAVRQLPTPVTLLALTVAEHELACNAFGDMFAAWRLAAEYSAQRHIQWCDKPYQRVLSGAPRMYDELWTAAKVMYKMEAAMQIGGEVIIYAPHLEVVSHVQGRPIHEIGYHTLPNFLDNWQRYNRIPLGVLAHSTHLRGSGRMENGLGKPNVRVTARG